MGFKEANEFFWAAFGGIITLITIILLVLKLTDNFAAEWPWVFCLFWIPLGFTATLGICLGPFRIFEAIQHSRRQNAAIAAELDAELSKKQ